MELHDEDPVNPETWEWLEQGKDGKPMRHLDVVHPIPQISADGMIWSMHCFLKQMIELDVFQFCCVIIQRITRPTISYHLYPLMHLFAWFASPFLF
jgi:hypothetical protein